jgi:enoyl-CoA hydratase/carnithine racemase
LLYSKRLATNHFVHVEQRGEAAVLRLDRPKVNVLSAALLRDLADVVRDLGAAPPRALVLWGGEHSFSAGVDIAELADDATAPLVLRSFGEALDLLASFPRATIAAITGFALGGGLELALACDFRVVGEDARLGLPEVGLGVIPGGGGTQRLPRLLGPARAKELVLSGRSVGAGEAVRIGLAEEVAAPAEVLPAAIDFASRFTSRSPTAQAAAKRAIDQGLELPLEEALALEGDLFEEVRRSADGQAGMRAFLAHKLPASAPAPSTGP